MCNRTRADGLSGVVGTGREGSFTGKRGRTRLSRVMAAKDQYKGNRKLRQASEKSEGRVVLKKSGNADGGKAPCFHRVC